MNESIDGQWSITNLQNDTERNELFLGVAESFGGFSTDDDIVADSRLREQRNEASISLQTVYEKHNLFGELIITDIEIDKSEQFINLDPVTNLPAGDMSEFPAPVSESDDRSSVSLVLQDEYRVDNRLTITGGIRFDDYEDIDSSTAPRIAMVWRKSDQHLFKSQIARAFRPPSLIESGGSIGSAVDPEINDTFELGYIYHDTSLILRNTLYFSKLDNLIVFQDSAPFGYLNTDSQDLYGYEVELEKSLGNKWDISANLSLQEYRDQGLTGAAPWMMKLGASYTFLPLNRLHLQLNCISKRDREETDNRSDFEQQTQLNLSFSHDRFVDVNGLVLNWGLLNLLDEQLAHPAPLDTYAEDYPYSEETALWARLIYRP